MLLTYCFVGCFFLALFLLGDRTGVGVKFVKITPESYSFHHMEFYMKKLFACSVAVLFSSYMSYAGAGIIDTANDSFIDESTGLEWMDFGVNNNYSFDFVSENLGVGGLYEGWRVATYSDMETLFNNAFYGIGAVEYTGYPDPNDLHASAQSFYSIGSILDPIFEIMGGGSGQTDFFSDGFSVLAHGLYKGSTSLSLFSINNITTSSLTDVYFDHASLVESIDLDGVASEPAPLLNTMLVRTANTAPPVSVPESSSLMLLVLGLMGLMVRRLAKN